MHFVYIIQSSKDDSYYIGETSDIDERLKFHNKGLQRYTKRKCPWELVHIEEYGSKAEALKREKEIKRKKSKKYINHLIGIFIDAE